MTTSTPDSAIDAKAAELKTTHGVKIGVVPVDGGALFFRQPTAEAYDEHVSLAESPEKHRSFARYVRGCYLGALIAGEWSGPDGLSAVLSREGPAFLAGPCGAAVNRLSGAKERAPARFF